MVEVVRLSDRKSRRGKDFFYRSVNVKGVQYMQVWKRVNGGGGVYFLTLGCADKLVKGLIERDQLQYYTNKSGGF